MDIEALLAPVASSPPCGLDLRAVAGSNALTEAREHRRAEDASRVGPEAKSADWPAVARTCVQGLQRASKDLELAAYLIEAWTRTEGIDGLARGLAVLHGLLERYWEQLHPGRDSGAIDVEYRVAMLARSGGSGVVDAVRQVPLTVAVGNSRPFTMRDYLDAEDLEKAARTRPAEHKEMVERGVPTRQLWQQALAATPTARTAQNVAALRASLAALTALEATCQRLVPANPPSFLELRTMLEATVAALDSSAAQPAQGNGTQATASPSAAPLGSGPAGPINSRQAAVQRLGEVAAYLRATEPHSPVSLLIERCVRWLNMPFEDLMRDLVKTPDVLKSMRETLGLPPHE
jgi:type VI secretion system protein ImpA